MIITGRMTKERFVFLRDKAGRAMTGEKTNQAAYDVLVNGLSQTEAASRHDVSVSAVSGKVNKILSREEALASFLGGD